MRAFELFVGKIETVSIASNITDRVKTFWRQAQSTGKPNFRCPKNNNKIINNSFFTPTLIVIFKKAKRKNVSQFKRRGLARFSPVVVSCRERRHRRRR